MKALVAIGVFAVFLLLGYSTWTMATMNTKIDTIVRIQQEHAMPSQLQTTWVDHNGLNHTVTTYRNTGENATDFAARHKQEVDALLALYPK